jgi:hypothetical protein
MKKIGILIWLVMGLISPAGAEVIILDNYEGMSVNIPLTGMFRTPSIGPVDSVGWISSVGGSGAQVIIGLDNLAAGVNVPQGGALDYLANFKQVYSGGSYRVEWDMMVNRVGSDPGLFMVRFPTPDNNMQILFGFMNDGRLIRFDLQPSPSSLVEVGTFMQDTRYAVALTYDLDADRYSVALNGLNVIMAQAIPSYLNGVSIDRFGFDINQSEAIQLNGQIPQGNSYWVDNVRFSRIEPVPEPGLMLLIFTGLAWIASLKNKIKSSEKRVAS